VGKNECQGSESENEMASQKEETRLNSIPVTKSKGKNKNQTIDQCKIK
jgi:hypothetical protein